MTTTLRQHMTEMHRDSRLSRSNADLIRQHKHEHWQLHTNHVHNPGWPSSPDSRPPGWTTGEDAVLRSQLDEEFRSRLRQVETVVDVDPAVATLIPTFDVDDAREAVRLLRAADLLKD